MANANGTREADVAEVQDRRVEQHEDVVLQQRVRARARRTIGIAGGERVGRAEAEQGEERHHDEHHDERPADERVARCGVRKRQPTAAVNPARTTTHSRIEPSSADHIAATL